LTAEFHCEQAIFRLGRVEPLQFFANRSRHANGVKEVWQQVAVANLQQRGNGRRFADDEHGKLGAVARQFFDGGDGLLQLV
jgi:hypothetical protein